MVDDTISAERRNVILPRLIRQRDAPAYLGMNRNHFDIEVRPHLTEVPLGTRAIAYDRQVSALIVSDPPVLTRT